jgi:hypothetical protein
MFLPKETFARTVVPVLGMDTVLNRRSNISTR